MSSYFARSIDGIIDALNENVAPRVTDEYARGQIFSIIYLLSELRIRGDWGQGWLLDHLAVHERAFAAIGAAGGEADGIPPPPFGTVGEDRSVERLLALRTAADQYLCDLQTWLRDMAEGPVRTAVRDAIHRALREQSAIEAALTPKPMYSRVAKG